MKPKSISTLVMECREGKEESMTALYEVSVSKIVRQLHKIGMQHADMEDVIQETMIRVYAKLDQINTPEHYASWLYKVTKSVYIHHFRMHNCYLCDGTSDDIVERRPYMLPINCMETIENTRVIQLHMRKLKTVWQEVLVLKYLKELSEEEISKELNIPKGTVKSRLYYAKLNLQVQ